MPSSLGSAAATDLPPAGDPEFLLDVDDEDEYEIVYEIVEEEIEVEEEVEEEVAEEVEAGENDDGDAEVLQELIPDHQNDASQVIETRSGEVHFQSGSTSPGDLVADISLDDHRVQGYSGTCEISGSSETRKTKESSIDGKDITTDQGSVASLSNQGGSNNGKTDLPGEEVDDPVLTSGAANIDLHCEKETDQTSLEDSKQVASRVRPRTASPSTEFNNGSKRQAMVCEFFAKGWCIKGDSCKFLHTKDHDAVSGQEKEGTIDAAEKKSELDDEASSILHISQSDGRESLKLDIKMQEFPLRRKDPSVVSSISLDKKAIGREFDVEDHSHHSALMSKDKSFHGAGSCSPGRSPEKYGCVRISSHTKSLVEETCKASQFQDLSVSNSSFYRSQSPYSYSARYSDPFGTHKLLDKSRDQLNLRPDPLRQNSSPVSGSDSKQFSQSNILGNAQHSTGCKTNIPYDWEPSSPFRPSFLISQKLLSAVSLYDPLRDSIDRTSSEDEVSKSLFSGQESSVVGAQRTLNGDSLSKGIFSQDCSLNKYYTKNFSGKDLHTTGTGAMESVGTQWQKCSISQKEEKLPSLNHVGNAAETNEIFKDHNSEIQSAGSRYNTEVKREGSGQKVEAASDLKVEGHLQLESRTLKYFHAALVEFVKELLKPTWHVGILSKDAYKIIVKKTVDKVLSTLQPQQIPNTSESVKNYLSSSKPKLAKLVEAYVDKHGRS